MCGATGKGGDYGTCACMRACVHAGVVMCDCVESCMHACGVMHAFVEIDLHEMRGAMVLS